MYNLLHGRSSLLLDYSNISNDTSFKGFDKIESVWTNSRYDSPVTCWLHTQGSAIEKITALYPSF
jgi:hypothetical protein